MMRFLLGDRRYAALPLLGYNTHCTRLSVCLTACLTVCLSCLFHICTELQNEKLERPKVRLRLPTERVIRVTVLRLKSKVKVTRSY